MRRGILAFLCGIICFMFGCKSGVDKVETTKSTNTYAVVVGMEKSNFAGSCPGAGLDSERMYKLLSKYTSNIVLLRDSTATKNNIVYALNNAVTAAREGLVIFYYSGHGGSEPFPDTGTEETDGKDEFLCPWDTWLRDNEIWSIISKSRGRVLMVVDACHSQTMMKTSGFRMKIPMSWDHTMTENVPFSLLCWSGCPDDTYSYGASSGGQFTNALLRHFDSTKTYEALWKEIKNDSLLREFENPQSTALGGGFDGKNIFK